MFLLLISKWWYFFLVTDGKSTQKLSAERGLKMGFYFNPTLFAYNIQAIGVRFEHAGHLVLNTNWIAPLPETKKNEPPD